MKLESLQEVAGKKNMTLERAAEEIICAAGERKRSYPAAIRRQKIPAQLLSQAKAYETRRKNQFNAAAQAPGGLGQNNQTKTKS